MKVHMDNKHCKNMVIIMGIAELEKVFLKRCEEYAKRINSLGTKMSSDKKNTFFSIFLPMIKLQFIYSKKRSAFDLPSTIFVRVYLNKNNDVFFHIPELLSFLDIDDFRACYFPYIESEKRMNCCFDALTDVLDTHLAEFENIASNYRAEKMRKYQFDSIKDMYALKNEDYDNLEQYIMMLEVGEGMSFLHRYTDFGAYYDLCCGKREEAIMKYGKLISKNKAFAYEKRLLNFISKPENADFKPIAEECFSYKEAKPYLTNDNVFSWKSLLFSLTVTTVSFFLVSFIIEAIMSAGAAASFGLTWWVVLIFAAISSVAVTIGFSDKINKLVGDKNIKDRTAFNSILESKIAKDIGEVLFRSLSAICFVFIVYCSFLTTNIYDTHILTPSDEGMFETTRIEYEDIEKIYYMDARYNIYGDRLERPSYVLILNDGNMFDFDMVGTAEETEEYVLPLLEKYELEIIRVDSDKDIPGYAEYYIEDLE